MTRRVLRHTGALGCYAFAVFKAEDYIDPFHTILQFLQLWPCRLDRASLSALAAQPRNYRNLQRTLKEQRAQSGSLLKLYPCKYMSYICPGSPRERDAENDWESLSPAAHSLGSPMASCSFCRSSSWLTTVWLRLRFVGCPTTRVCFF